MLFLYKQYIIIFSIIFLSCLSFAQSKKRFIFGAATSAYQVEGAWNEDGRGVSFCEYLVHNTSLIKNGDTGDVACDSYHKLKEDVRLLKELGVSAYRFSISWVRLLPNGTAQNGVASANPYGVAYYDQLLDALLANNIIPMVTLYHFDMPMRMAQQGGFQNSQIIPDMAAYADIVFQLFGNKVRHWFTINEPNTSCYADLIAAQLLKTGYENNQGMIYMCTRNVLLSHATIYRLYEKKYKPYQHGSVSLVIDTNYYETGSGKKEDIEAAERYRQFQIGKWAHPIYKGDFPHLLKEYVAKASRKQGLPISKLPKFSPEEIVLIKGTNDYYSLNYYTSRLVYYNASNNDYSQPDSSKDDAQISLEVDPTWRKSPTSSFLYVTPKSFRQALKYVHDHYNKPRILITENGYGDTGEINDQDRIDYMKTHLEQLRLSMSRDNVRVFGYLTWSLMDNFEWFDGYTSHFGLYSVDFNDPNRTRRPKASTQYYQDIIKSKIFDVID